MAGRGPAPKRPEERHDRRSKGFETLPAEGYQGEFPELPITYMQRTWDGEKHVEKRVRFLPSTRDWYQAWARSPMAVEFTEVHWLRLQSLAKLQDRFDRGDMTVAAELRQGLAAFGGSPLDVRRLGRTIDRTQGDGEPRAQPARSASDRRARLELVAPDA
jgi:hypothetical protein